jgi:hypothetical protein
LGAKRSRLPADGGYLPSGRLADAESDYRAVRGRSDGPAVRSRRPNVGPVLPINPWLIWTVGGVVGVIGVFLVLWLTEPEAPSPPGVRVMANSSVSDSTTLMAAVQTAALRGTLDVKGAVDQVKRAAKGKVTLRGWVTDIAAGGSPLTVMAFAAGKHVLTTTTKGERRDIAQALGLSERAAANLSFEGTLSCDRGQKLIVVAITRNNTYGHFGSLVCP